MPDLKKLITLEALQAALPSWLKSSSKPSYTADEISDTNTTNKFVTSADKSTWNAKGTYSKPTGGIPKSDLSQLVQDSLDLADSALQSESDPTVPSWAKQTNKPSYTQDEVTDGTTYKRVTSTEKSTWNNKQSALTTTQMSAVNSGIDSTKVGQISTNQSNIWYAIDTGVKNWFVVPDGTYSSKSAANSSVCSVENGVVKIITCSTADTRVMTLGTITLPAGTYKLSNYIFGGSPNYGDVRLMNPDGSRLSPTGDGVFTIAAETIATVKVYTWSASALNASVSPFLCVKSIYDQDTSYQPPALPNYDLTRLEAEDRAGLVECVDGGAKNLLKIEGETREVNGVTATYNSDGSITTSGTATGGNANFTIRTYTAAEAVKLSGLVLSGCPSGGSDATWNLILQKNSFNYDVYARDTGDGAVVGTVPSTACVLILQIKSGYSKNTTWYPMLCTKAAFGVSQKFVPYRPDWDVIADSIKTVQIANSDFITGNTNFTILSQSTLFKHGSQVFGTLVIQKTDTTKFGDSSVTVGTIKSGYRPVVNLIGQSYYNTDQWGANGFGYSYINTSGIVNVKASSDSSGKYSYVAIPINYMTA